MVLNAAAALNSEWRRNQFDKGVGTLFDGHCLAIYNLRNPGNNNAGKEPMHEDLRQALLASAPIDSNRLLKAIFFHEKLRVWRDRIPEGSTRAERVDQLLDFLHEKRTVDGELAIVVFLRACAERLDPNDLGHGQLLSFAQALSEQPRLADANPYRGLHHFREVDAGQFFGRNQKVEQLLGAVVGRQSLITLMGPSGIGKSSVVFAGLLPELRRRDGWQVLSFRPGYDPLLSLAGALVEILEDQLTETARLVEARRLVSALESGDVSFDAVLNRIREKEEALHILLLVDQFEELFALSAQPVQQRFLDLCLGEVELVTRLLVMRADFLGEALAHRHLAEALQETANRAINLMLGPMNRSELRKAIERPAIQAGVQFEKGLVARILDDLESEPGNLPLLQFALTQLWQRQSSGTLTHAAYGAVGGVVGALAQYAEEIYARLGADKQKYARKLFVQLVNPGAGTDDTRRVALRRELGQAQWELAQRLATARLVVTGQDMAGEQTVELAHEALIRYWGRLKSWMDADRAFRTWQERTRVLVRYWYSYGKDPEALLRGAPLSEAEGWFQEREEELSGDERAFIEASIERREEKKSKREALQRSELVRLQREAERVEQLRQEKTHIEGIVREIELELADLKHAAQVLEDEQERQVIAATELETLQEEQPRLSATRNLLSQRIIDLKEGKGNQCPLCDRPLSAEHREGLLGELVAEGQIEIERFRANEERIEELEEELEILAAGLSKTDDVIRKIMMQRQQQATAEARLQEIKRAIRQWEEQDSRRLSELAEKLNK